MFSTRLLKMCAIITKFGIRNGSFLLSFDFDSSAFSITKDPSAVLKLRLNCCLMLFWLLCSLFASIKHKLEGNFNLYILTLTYTVSGFALMLIFSVLKSFPHDTCRMLDGTLRFYRYFQSKFMPGFSANQCRLNMWIDYFVFSFSLICFSVVIFITLYCLSDPRAAIFLGSLIPLKYYSYNIATALITSTFHGYVVLIMVTNIVLIGSIVMVYLFYLTTILTKELKLGRPKYRTVDMLRKPANLRIVYRSFQVLNENAMCFMGPYITTFHGLFVAVPTLINFLLIRYWRELDLLSKLPLVTGCWLMTVFWMLVLQLGKYLWVRGNKILGSWRRCDWNGSKLEAKIMRKFTKSCRPILILHGKQLVVGRMTQFYYFKAVARGIFRSLLALGK